MIQLLATIPSIAGYSSNWSWAATWTSVHECSSIKQGVKCPKNGRT